MSDKSFLKLLKASEKASIEQIQHLVVVLTPDGRVQVTGSANIVNSVTTNEELYRTIQTTMLDNMEAIGNITPSIMLDYPLLPCSPFSPHWKGSAMIRGVLSKMLVSAGYGKSGRSRKLGVGNPPTGWPDHISWTDFSGATRSKLSSNEVTDIIISMLEAANIDPDRHVRQAGEEDAVSGESHYAKQMICGDQLEPEMGICVKEEIQIKQEEVDHGYDIGQSVTMENGDLENEIEDLNAMQNFEIKREPMDILEHGHVKRPKTS